MNKEKLEVHDFWNSSSCGEELYLNGSEEKDYDYQSNKRYELEGDLIFPFAKFQESKKLKVLEIGVGLGADHQKFAEAGANIYGIDLTKRSIEHTKKRLEFAKLYSNLSIGDAEYLKFEDNSFDLIYSWGVFHHSPNTSRAIKESFRILKKDGVARIMIYHKWSVLGFMLWFRFALMTLKPWTTLNDCFSKYQESPGTKAYSYSQARVLFSDFKSIDIKTPLSHADLLSSNVGQRHRGNILAIAKFIWPRWIIRKLLPNSGVMMLIEARK